MFADTEAIRALGAVNSTYADDLADIAATLSSLSLATSGSSLGPVASRFLSALTDAVADGARAVTAISDHLRMSSPTTNAIAAAYDSADDSAGVRIAGV